MIYASQLPAKFHSSDLYKTYLEEYFGEKMKLAHKRPLKLDDEYCHFLDVLQILDTCAYLGCALPWNVFDFAYSSPPGLVTIMKEFLANSKLNSNGDNAEYYHFANTPEFMALKTCAEYCCSVEAEQGVTFVSYAIKYGSLLLVKYFEHKCRYLFPKHMNTIWLTVQYGHVDILEYFSTKPWFKEVCNTQIHLDSLTSNAIHYGKVKVLEFLHKKLGLEIDNELIDDAISIEAYECLVYLLTNNVKPSYHSLGIAIGNAELKYIVALVESGASLNNDSYTLFAAQRGRLDVLQYLHEKNAPWHDNAVNAAARKVRLYRQCFKNPEARYRECAEFGLKNNAPYDPEIIQKYLHTEQWCQKLQKFGLPVPQLYPTDDIWMLDVEEE